MEEALPPQLIELEPFIHQVGGHSFMLSLDPATVCKPTVARELQFYQTLSQLKLLKFTPKFYGVIEVQTVHTDDGYVKFLARPPPNYVPVSSVVESPASHKVRLRRSGSIEVTDCEESFIDDQAETQESLDTNPWVVKCHRDNMTRVIQELEQFQQEEGHHKNFIVLENLTWKFSCPCILDLKMGTRQYGDAASLAKKQSKMYKVVSTTSAKLGLRVGGMQVYQVPTKHYLCRNKFYGRTLSVGGFQQTLAQFLHNGARFRSDVLPILIRRLEELVQVLGRQEAIRFYTTSLLLLYEGEDFEADTEPVSSGRRQHEQGAGKLYKQESIKRLVTSGSVDNEPLRKTSSAESLTGFEGVVKGVPLRRRSSAAHFDTSFECSSESSSDSTIFEDCCDPVRRNSKTLSLADSFRSRSFSIKSDSSSHISDPVVDVKMIDFAHSTHKALDDPVVYSGPDRGFIYGLEKLIGILKTLETDYG